MKTFFKGLGIFLMILFFAQAFGLIKLNAHPSQPVAIFKIEGPIFTSIDTVKKLEELSHDDVVKAVVIRVDSPGGDVASSQEIYQQILKLRQQGKVVVASMGTLAASGGYYVSCAAQKIVASPGTLTGSIGVIMSSFGVGELAKKLMIEPRVIKSGEWKDSGSPFREVKVSEKEYFQALSNNIYQQFVSDVAKQRGKSVDEVAKLAEGRIYSGAQALDAGLVDQLGNLYDAIDLAKSEAKLPPDAGVMWPPQPNPFEKFIGGDGAEGLVSNFLEGVRLFGSKVPLAFY